MSDGPVTHDVDPEGIPAAMRERDTWVCWRIEVRDEKPTKVPIDAETGEPASSTDDTTWTDFETALATHRGDDVPTAGIGFVFSPTGPFVGIDLDYCRDPDADDPGDALDDWARELIECADTFAEWSPSDTGLHLIAIGELPDGGNRSGDVEMYDEARFFTVTGQHVTGTPTEPQARQDAIDAIHAEYVTGDDDPAQDAAPAAQRTPATPADLDDRELLEKAEAADNGAKFRRLWTGDTSGYDSHSEARMALLNLLAFWTGGDARQMDRLYRDSGLHPHPSKPEKWDRLGDEEIQKAIANTTEFYEPGGGGPARASADGGATTAPTGDAGVDTHDWDIRPPDVVRAALDDPYGRLERTDDGAAPTIHDLQNPEAAEYTWEVMDRADKDDVLYSTSGLLYAYDDGVWNADGEQRLREYGQQALRSKYSKRIRRELEERTKTRLSFHPEELGAPDGTLAVENGLLHLLDGDLEELTREHRALRRAPVEYDPDAPAPERWLQFLDESIADETGRLKFQEYCGYALWHHAQPFGKVLFLVGPTDSGKGTALAAVQAVLGDDNVANESLYNLIQTRWGLANLHDKAVNIRNEVTPGGLSNIQQFKELAGGEDRVTAEFKGEDKFQFTVTQKFLFATNEMPTIEDADEAFYSRCLFVRFPETVDDPDEHLDDKLRAEKAGIFNWMLEGLRRLMDQGHFTGEREIDAKKEICDAFGSVLDRFVYTCLDVTGDSRDMVAKSDLCDLAQEYADAIDKEPDWNAQSGFTRKLKGSVAGIGDGQTRKLGDGNTKVFTGVRLDADHIDGADTDVRARTSDDDSTGQQRLG